MTQNVLKKIGPKVNWVSFGLFLVASGMKRLVWKGMSNNVYRWKAVHWLYSWWKQPV